MANMCLKNFTFIVPRPRLRITQSQCVKITTTSLTLWCQWVKKIENRFSLPQLPVSLSFCESRISFSLWMTLALALTTLGVANSVALLWGPMVNRKVKRSGLSHSCTKYCTVKSNQGLLQYLENGRYKIRWSLTLNVRGPNYFGLTTSISWLLMTYCVTRTSAAMILTM